MQINDKCCVVAMSQRRMQSYTIKWDDRFLVQIHLDISQVFNQILRKSTKKKCKLLLISIHSEGICDYEWHNIWSIVNLVTSAPAENSFKYWKVSDY